MTDLTNLDLVDETADNSIQEGAGLFDVLMRATSARLEQEHKAGRIQSGDFAKIYLGAMESALSQSIAYLLQKHTANENAKLIIAQTAETAARTGLVNTQQANAVLEGTLITARTATEEKQSLVLDAQIAQSEAQTSILGAQEGYIAIETAHTQARTANEVLQGTQLTAVTAKTNSEKAMIDQEFLTAVVATENATKSGLQIDAQTAFIAAQEFKLENIDTPLTVAQTSKSVADKNLVIQETANALTAASNIVKSGNKLDAEIGLLDQRRNTEQAQIHDVVNSTAVSGLIGRQKSLYTAQEEGFARDAEQKAAKIAVDAWSVRSSVDPDTMTEPSGIADADITAIMARVKAGIGA